MTCGPLVSAASREIYRLIQDGLKSTGARNAAADRHNGLLSEPKGQGSR